MTAINDDPLKLDREVDWVIKHKLLTGYADRNETGFDDPHIALLDLQYHHVHSTRGVFYLMQRAGHVERVLDEADVSRAIEEAPQTTRARLRGAFVREAKARRRDYTVDWVHLKLNDQAQRTVLCKDPFRSHDERVDKLIESL